jgi:membrane associated rhomboid family serine protease
VQRIKVQMATPQLVTRSLIAVMAAVQVMAMIGGSSAGGSSNRFAPDFAVWGPGVSDGEWWRMITAGFLHYGLLHILFNCWALYAMGGAVESALGRWRYLGLFVVSVLGGSAGSLLLEPGALAAGASGGVFGVMAAGVIATRKAGIPFNASGYGPTLLMNFVLTFAIPGISIGGHAGGAAVGGLAGLLLFAHVRRRNDAKKDMAALVILAVLCLAVGVFAAGRA